MPKSTKEKTLNSNKEIVEKKAQKNISISVKKEVSKTISNKSKSQKTSTKAKNSSSKKTEAPKTKRTKSTKPSKKVASKKTVSKSLKKKSLLAEYYDLPYRYNQTVVKILAQTPKKLFVYWEISDYDRNNFINTYGDNFFNITKPVLIIHNLTMNYTFEIDINDFANSWYININDADCLYGIELGRRPLTFNQNFQNSYIYISSSNNLQTPNNHILFENINSNTVFNFKNTKTKEVSLKSFANVSSFANANKIYNFNNFYDLYKKLYGENILKELIDTKLNNPSSGAISSFK